MGLQLIPIAVGTAVGAAAACIITDQRLRSRIADESLLFGLRINAYFTGPPTGQKQAKPSAPTAPTQQAPQPTHQPNQQRCEAMTKAGNRCRSKTHAIVSMSLDSGGVAKYALCSVHSGIHEKGGTVALADKSEALSDP